MPPCVSRNPQYSKHKASGQTVVTIDGQDIYLGPWKSKASLVGYDRVIAEWLAAGRKLPGSRALDLTVAHLIERYWDFAKGYYRHADGTSTRELSPIQLALRELNRLYGSAAAHDFGPLALDAVRNAMIDKDWCRSTINKQITRLKAMFKWAMAQELIPPSVYHGLQAVAGLRAGRTEARESCPVRPVDDEVIDLTRRHMSSVVATMAQVQRFTGARPGGNLLHAHRRRRSICGRVDLYPRKS
jgi:hypothetical protein